MKDDTQTCKISIMHNYMHMHIFPEYTLKMHCMCLMTQQVPLDDTWAFGKKIGAERTPKDQWGHVCALQSFLCTRVNLEERI